MCISQSHYLLSVCQEAGDSLTDGGGELSSFRQEEVWDDSVKSQAEVHKQDPHIKSLVCLDVVLHFTFSRRFYPKRLTVLYIFSVCVFPGN